MNKIERYSNWCDIDRLDGVDIYDGEPLFVRFPDGACKGVEVVVKQSTYPVSEQGGQWNHRESLAYAQIDYHGVKALVPLVGLEARRV